MRCSFGLLPLALAAALAGGDSLHLEAPGARVELREGGVVTVAGGGFVARYRDWLLSGEALRWDQRRGIVWASGAIVLVMPGLRLHAERLGLRLEERIGDAWEVQAWLERGERRLRVTAARVELRPDRLTFHDVSADAGHGSVFAATAARLTAWLREQPRLDKGEREIDRYVSGIEIVRPTLWAAGLPVLWLPWLYRDYLLDYPWSTLEAGRSRRLGWWLRYTIGSDLPEIAGWKPRLHLRVDRHTRAGNGGGLEAFWRHARFGRGRAMLYRLFRERVADPRDEDELGGEREATAVDAAHQVGGEGWALAGRYTALPDADPAAGLPPTRSPDERFRADYLRRQLEREPFARQGASGSWSTPWMTLTASAERRPNRWRDESERLGSVTLTVPRCTLAGPLAFEGQLAVERLRQEIARNEAARAHGRGGLALAQWWGGLGLDALLGARGVAWWDGVLAGRERWQHDSLLVPEAAAGLSQRWLGGGEDWSASLEPRLGLQLLGARRGDGNPGYDFGDGVDRPEADRRYLVSELRGESRWAASAFSGELRARWGLRRDDREALDELGVRHRGPWLADVALRLRGSPRPDVEAIADGLWDARLERWLRFDVRARWQAHERLELLYNGTLVPETASSAAYWVHRAGTSLALNRYRLDSWGELRPGSAARSDGRRVDLWGLAVLRRLVDGTLGVSYENAAEPGHDIDHRVALSFSIGAAAPEPARAAFGF
ncbi:MAG: hypothetical protein RMM29_09250 [Planctomycetota bacterium]|nr:hypothetical protein [Planctomycetota bacterium]MCX8039576.1 hypothetical protein [Planctomycetota bacterium]MDW8373814.1 hypothetical protein [Planctomycetota bacterium]